MIASDSYLGINSVPLDNGESHQSTLRYEIGVSSGLQPTRSTRFIKFTRSTIFKVWNSKSSNVYTNLMHNARLDRQPNRYMMQLNDNGGSLVEMAYTLKNAEEQRQFVGSISEFVESPVHQSDDGGFWKDLQAEWDRSRTTSEVWGSSNWRLPAIFMKLYNRLSYFLVSLRISLLESVSQLDSLLDSSYHISIGIN